MFTRLNPYPRRLAMSDRCSTDPSATHYEGCACHEQGWKDRLEAVQSELNGLRAVRDRVTDWHGLSDAGLRLRCGDMTAQEIRTVRAVLRAIFPNHPDMPR